MTKVEYMTLQDIRNVLSNYERIVQQLNKKQVANTSPEDHERIYELTNDLTLRLQTIREMRTAFEFAFDKEDDPREHHLWTGGTYHD